MPLSRELSEVLAAIRANRNSSSWVAGSVVLAPHIERVPADIDIHHDSWDAFRLALDKDRTSLWRAGFLEGLAAEKPLEVEISFSRSEAVVALNWVMEGERPDYGVAADPLLGFAVHKWGAIVRKISMVLEDGGEKHITDLAALERNGFPIRKLVIDVMRDLGAEDRETLEAFITSRSPLPLDGRVQEEH